MFVWYVTVLLEYIKNIEEGVSNWWIFANNLVSVSKLCVEPDPYNVYHLYHFFIMCFGIQISLVWSTSLSYWTLSRLLHLTARRKKLLTVS